MLNASVNLRIKQLTSRYSIQVGGLGKHLVVTALEFNS